ncbi:MAG TPA: hypothetical protein VI583_17650, partial [Cyclobacteriaceae bacterium]|nr:hypothetical protein [Cyclobacteriaceae bacterium]
MALILASTLLVGIIATYQFPTVQTKTGQFFASYLSRKIGMQITIERININWFGDIVLTNIRIIDHKGEILIAADKIRGRFNPSSLFRDKTIVLTKLIGEHCDVRMVRQNPDEDYNLGLFVKRIKALSDSPGKKKGKSKFVIQSAELHNSSFTLSDPYKDSIRTKFNYNQFKLRSIEADLGRLESYAGEFSLRVNDLSFADSATDLNVNSLQALYSISDSSMSFMEFILDAGHSRIEAGFAFQYNHLQAFKSFNDSVTISAEVKKSKIESGDLALFAPYFRNIDESFDLKGKFSGRINSFDLRDFTLMTGNISRITGNLYLNGLPNFQNTFMDIQIRNSVLNPEDLNFFIPANAWNISNTFGNSSFIGRFTGFPNDFVAFAKFFTQIGDIDSDINIKISGKENTPNYIGNLVTRNFDIGKLFNNENFLQMLDMNGYIRGKGVGLEKMDFNLKATIDRIGIHRYDYTGIQTDGRLSRNIFEGFLSINDPNLKFHALANVNLEKNREKLKIKARLDTAFLQPLNITKKFAYLSSDFDVDFNGLHIDSLTGSLTAENTNFVYGDNGITIDHMNLLSSNTDSTRNFSFDSDLFNISIQGDFDYTTTIRNIPKILNEYKLLIRNDSAQNAEYFDQNHDDDAENYNLKYNITFRKFNPFLQLFVPEIDLAENIQIFGFIEGSRKTRLGLISDIDTIIYKGTRL